MPPTIGVSHAKTQTKAYREQMLDFMENEGFKQFHSNLNKFQDYYDMFDGTLSKKELKEMLPQYEDFDNILNKVNIPTYLRHYDFLGAILRQLVGRFSDFKQKFNVIEQGDVAENEFLDFKKKEIISIVNESIDVAVRLALAENGINIDEERQFSSPEEQQQFYQQVEQIKQQATPKIAERISRFPHFKTIGIEWGNHILDRDEEELERDYAKLFKHWLITGVCAKITKIHYDTYKSYVWDSREVFHSREIGLELLNRAEYVGRYHFKTPSQVVEEYGHRMDEKTRQKVLNSDYTYSQYKNDNLDLQFSKPNSISDLFTQRHHVPIVDHFSREAYRKVEDYTGLPMGIRYIPNSETGSFETAPTYMPRYGMTNFNLTDASYIERNHEVRHDTCQVTEVYVRMYEKLGWLTYETEEGDLVREVVTEEILPEFLKEKGIKQKITVTFSEMLSEELEPNTLIWQSMPVYYEGVKINGAYLNDEPIYLYFDKLPYQITDLSTFDVKNPVSGIVTSGIASRIAPYQEMFNISWNYFRQKLERDVGMVYVTDVMNIPSEFLENGESVEEALYNQRAVARATGMMVNQTNPEYNQAGNSIFNQYTVLNLSDVNNMQVLLSLSDRIKTEGYMQIGITPNQGLQDTQYQTQEGIKLNNEVTNYQLSDIFDTFNQFVKEDMIQHLNIMHFLQSMNMDKAIYYTNSTNHTVFLQVSQDEKFSMRRIGLTASQDSRKKKQLENIRMAILNNNTTGADAYGIIRIALSDSVSELTRIAEEERALTEERQRLQNEAIMQQEQQKAQLLEQSKQADWERMEISKERDRVTDLDKAKIKAIGDAADNNATMDQLDYITRTADIAIKATEAENKNQQKLKELEIKERTIAQQKQAVSDNLKLAYDKMSHEERMKQMDSDIATKHLADR